MFENSLLIVMGSIWLGSWFAQSLTGWRVYNNEALDHGEATLGWLQYLGSAEFWETTLQNWQSEFLAVGSMAVLAIYLRALARVQAGRHAARVDGGRGVNVNPACRFNAP